MTAEAWFVVLAVLAPIAVLGLAMIARGYHLHLKVWRGDRPQPLDREPPCH